MVMAYCYAPVFVHPVAIAAQVFHCYYMICSEGFALAQKEFEGTWAYRTLKNTFIILAFFAIATT